MNNLLSKLPSITLKKGKRLGRGIGSGRGSKSGRGTTRHQKARENIPLHFEGGQGRIVKKYPLLRGKGRNRSLSHPTSIIRLFDLEKFEDGETVDMKALMKNKIIGVERSQTVKVLGEGKLSRKLTVKLSVSQSAKKAIEKAGGVVES